LALNLKRKAGSSVKRGDAFNCNGKTKSFNFRPAEVNWLIDHVRWDVEEDLSKLMGDAAANTLVSMGRQAFQAMQQFIRKPAPGTDLHRTAL